MTRKQLKTALSKKKKAIKAVEESDKLQLEKTKPLFKGDIVRLVRIEELDKLKKELSDKKNILADLAEQHFVNACISNVFVGVLFFIIGYLVGGGGI